MVIPPLADVAVRCASLGAKRPMIALRSPHSRRLDKWRSIMSIDFAQVHIDFPTFNPRGANQEQRFFGEHTFGRRIRKATAAINGFELYFTQSDHHFQNILVGCDAIIDDAARGTVTARIKLKLADKNFDDPVDGWVTVVIFADLID
jgi:hypothetical protein